MSSAFKTACDAFDGLSQESFLAGCLVVFAFVAVADRLLSRRWSR